MYIEQINEELTAGQPAEENQPADLMSMGFKVKKAQGVVAEDIDMDTVPGFESEVED